MRESEQDLIQYPNAIKIIEDNNIGDLDPINLNRGGFNYGVVKYFGVDDPTIVILCLRNNMTEGMRIIFDGRK